ncbi:hypothetical protein EJ08DRAFT_238450 [Tothia fuscella]|uniref:Uncharacterized protein n=1 Tax=Tothia fuscella TaxID=1048955 RepID=A0A9P4NS00_9PEZI|nr:hypothetical protein EJ08DRAFT_238450 [Tothia fuscella]
MTATASNARLRYLNDSAHLLVYAAPSTAAFFQSCYDKVAEDEDIPASDARRREICGACGFNMLYSPLYLPITLKSEIKEKKVGEDPKDERQQRVLSCSACYSKTEFNLPVAKHTRGASKARTSAPSAASDANSASTITARVTTKESSAPAGVRKRAKGRKQQSLSAMLAKSKAEAAADKSGFGLDLMDLMKGA